MNLMTKEKMYNTLNAFYREKFGKKVFKVSLNGKFTCPIKMVKVHMVGVSIVPKVVVEISQETKMSLYNLNSVKSKT